MVTKFLIILKFMIETLKIVIKALVINSSM